MIFFIIWLVSAILSIAFIIIVDESPGYILLCLSPILNTIVVLSLIMTYLYLLFRDDSRQEPKTIKEIRKAKLRKIKKGKRWLL